MAASTRIRSVAKAVSMLEAFTAADDEVELTALSRRIGVPKSVAWKLARTLVDAGFLRQDPATRRYGIGPGVLRMAGIYLSSNPLTREGPEVLRRVAHETGHTASLGILDRGAALYVATFEGSEDIKMTARVGDRRPLHATATGKVLLADLPEAEVDRLLGPGPLPRFTDRTVTDVAALKRELEAVRATGVAHNIRERSAHIASVAAAVVGHTGRVVAAMSVGCPASAQTDRLPDELTAAVVEAAAELSRRLGGVPARERRAPDLN